MAKLDSDWKCPKCRKWHREYTHVCPCGHIPRQKFSRKQARILNLESRTHNFLVKHGMK